MDSLSTVANLGYSIQKKNSELEKSLNDKNATDSETVWFMVQCNAQLLSMHDEICSMENEMEEVLFDCVEVIASASRSHDSSTIVSSRKWKSIVIRSGICERR